jgi:uncharacterized protein YacL
MPLIIDTSTIISGMISKDLNTSGFLKGCEFILPSVIYDELDTKQPDLKEGGGREISRLRSFSEKEEIKFRQIDVENYHDIEIDKKLMKLLVSEAGVLITKDRNLANFSKIGSFAIHVVDSKEDYLKSIK